MAASLVDDAIAHYRRADRMYRAGLFTMGPKGADEVVRR